MGIVYVVIKGCLQSRIRSRTSRGVPEWLGGKDSYIGSDDLIVRSVSGVTGNVPGPSGRATSPKVLHGPRVDGNQLLGGLVRLGAPPLRVQGAQGVERG